MEYCNRSRLFVFFFLFVELFFTSMHIVHRIIIY